MKTISLKVGILYTFLAFINIAFFTIIIFENQSELLTENNQLYAKELANEIYSDIDLAMRSDIIDDNTSDSGIATIDILKNNVETISLKYDSSIKDYIIFDDQGRVLFTTNTENEINKHNIHDARRAITNKDFLGQLFYIKIDEVTYDIMLYIPIKVEQFNDVYLLLNLKMKNISKRLDSLYRLIIIIIIIITVFHIIFGFLLNQIVIRPIKILSRKSIEISQGNLAARVNIKSKDEIGQLGLSFNAMAKSVQDKIVLLDNQNQKMLDELKIAGKVQTAIYPKLRETDAFKLAVYHSPFTEVSGDYHDIFPLGNNKFGILIADVCGHGVPAALITMRIKEVFRNHASHYSDTKELMKFVNSELSDLMTDFDSYFTAFYLIIDCNTNELIYSNAGHSTILLHKKMEDNLATLDTKGAMIGVSDEINFSFGSKKDKLKSNDKIILFTDGILEARNEKAEQFDYENLIQAVEKHKNLPYNKMLEAVILELKKFVNKAKQFDDETMIIIQMK